MRTGRSPRLSAKPPSFESEKYIEAYELQPFVPRFATLPEAIKVIDPTDHLPSVKEVSFTDPEVVAIYFNAYGGAEPAVEFRSFTKGVAMAAFVMSQVGRERLPQAVETLASEVMNGAQIPPVSREFSDRVQHVVEAIFSNNEPMSWRQLLAFTNGAFWALGFVRSTEKKIDGLSPLTWVQAICERYAALGHLPQ